ncbi:MAG: virulence factor SrfC family protein [Planctomycetota bacterium]
MTDVGLTAAEAIVEWYWKHGIARQGAYAISPVWLKNLYQRRDLLRSIENGRFQKKASLGLWGPSQSGKSTLISQFVDQGADTSGKGGSLHWSSPTLFSSRDELPSEVIVFNPHNVGADASGCVSRFVLREDSEVPFHDFPVELRLLNPSQLMHAISAGYLSECQREDNWTVERLEELLEKTSGPFLRVDRQAFEQLHEVTDIIGMLIEARDERFTGLDAGGKWSSLSNRVIESRFLLSDKSKVWDFAAKLLWGGQASLTRLYERLMKVREKLPNACLYCSMEVAATLVNIESYRIFRATGNEELLPKGARRIKDVIRHLSWEDRGCNAVVGTNFPQMKLLEKDDDFGLLQGLVRELIIPLRSQKYQGGENQSSDFSRFMKSAELVDFPGVPLRDQNAKEKLLDLSSLPDSDDARLLTDVLKRGKVASLVIGYSRSLGLDAFMLLVRAGHFAPKPEQLHRGLIAWWKFVDPKYDVHKPQGRAAPLPLFFNMTFFANIIDKVAQGAVSTGLHPLTEMVKQLEPFVDPNVCTMLTTTYPQFKKEGGIDSSRASVDLAIKSILDDPSFGPRCAARVTKESGMSRVLLKLTLAS